MKEIKRSIYKQDSNDTELQYVGVYKYQLILCEKERQHSRSHKKLTQLSSFHNFEKLCGRQNSEDGLPRVPSHVYSNSNLGPAVKGSADLFLNSVDLKIQRLSVSGVLI